MKFELRDGVYFVILGLNAAIEYWVTVLVMGSFWCLHRALSLRALERRRLHDILPRGDL